MGHYDNCREGNCSICGQAEGYCEHTEHMAEKLDRQESGDGHTPLPVEITPELIKSLDAVPSLKVLYHNFRDEVRYRYIKPLATFYGTSRWHPEPQWLMQVWDVEKQGSRTFSMVSIVTIGDGMMHNETGDDLVPIKG